MSERPAASRGALGGAAGELGSEFRALVGAIFATAILADVRLADVGLAELQMRPTILIVEGDEPVDDLIVRDCRGRRVMTQAKVSVGLALDPRTPTAKAFKQFAEAIKSGLGPDDLLVLATARPTAGLRRLIDVLRRERCTVAGLRSTSEHEDADQMTAIARQFLNEEQTDELFKRLIIWTVDPPAYEAAVGARLDGAVAARGSGGAGTEALRSYVRELGRLRAGADAEQLVAGLTARNVPIAQGSDAAATVAEANALAAHRQRVRDRGEQLQLYRIAGELGEVPLLDADCAIEVSAENNSRNREEKLQVAVRRHRRILLIGDAGAGKSTALRALGAFAGRTPGWPTPVVAHVARLTKAEGSLTQRLLYLATEDASAGEQESLREALGRKLAAGEVLLILDGFDEIRAARWNGAMARMKKWLNALPPSTEVVLATRPVAAGVDAAGALGLDRFQLLAPEHASQTVTAILEAVAAADPDRRDSGWIHDREEWISQAFARDRNLRARPLTIVNLAVIAARATDVSALPDIRAEILLASLNEASQRWELEQREGELTIGRLNATEAKNAIALSLRTLCTLALLSADDSQQTVTAKLADRLGQAFGLAPVSAESAAEDALSFWVRAGVFALEDDQLTIRIRTLAEIGVADDWAHAPSSERDERINEARGDQGLWETLGLSAGLSTAIRREWGWKVAADGDADEIVAFIDVCRESEMPEPDLVAALLDRFPSVAAVPGDAERVGEALALLPLDDAQKRTLRGQTLDAVLPERQIMIRALFVCTWSEQGGGAAAALRELVACEWPVKPDVPEDDDGAIHIPDDSVDSLYQYVHDQAVLRIASLSRADAELAAGQYHPSEIITGHTLSHLLKDHGHDDLAEQIDERWRINFDWAADDAPPTTPQFLHWISDLSPRRQLTFEEGRRLQELADLFASAACNWIRPSPLERSREEFRGWIRAVARLADFDLPLLSAEAQAFAAELADDDEDRFFIYAHGQERLIKGWDGVDDVDAMLGDLLDALRVVPRQAQRQLVHAFVYCPEHERASAEAREMVGRANTWRASMIAEVAILTLAGASEERASELAREWIEHDNPFMRITAASWFSAQVRTAPQLDRDWRRCLQDEDAEVRLAALSHLDDAELDDQQRGLLRALADEPRGLYTCTGCGAINDSTAACSNCHSSAPDLRGRVSEILDPPKPREARDLTDLLSRQTEPRHVRRPSDDWP
jgi:NACHT domain